MRRAVLLSSLVLACGDNGVPGGVPLEATDHLIVVAHPADDLLFMQPELLETVQRGSLTTIYLRGAVNEGTLAAYAHAAGSSAWRCGDIRIDTTPAHHCRLAEPNISLVFVERGDLATLVRIVRTLDPDTVRTLEVTGTHGTDDPEHAEVGALAVMALAATNRSVELVSYRGEATAFEPANHVPKLYDETVAMLARYEACDRGCASCGKACTSLDQQHEDWLRRRYAIGFRRTGGGRLRAGNECLAVDLTMTSCPTAPIWRLDAAGELRAGDSCLYVDDAGSPGISGCVGGAARRWFIDDDGHVLSGARDLRCLTPRDGTARLETCNADNDPRWELVSATQSTARASIGLSTTGREVRLGDVTGDRWADLCTVDAGGLRCAQGTGLGTFGTLVRFDSLTSPLAIEPKSLVFGDVDGDGRQDACGRDASGILCATAASGFAAVRWTPAFADADVVDTSSASLTAIDADGDASAELCGITTQGLFCAGKNATVDGSLRSTSLAADAVVWFGDLDRDKAADWCTATDDGPVCSVWSHSTLTTDGSPWGYAIDGIVEVAPATTATAALGDFDGDGNADLCTLRDDRILCARSQRRGFGPRATLAILPNQTTGSALWLGDLDGDGRVDPCVDTGTDIVCARQP